MCEERTNPALLIFAAVIALFGGLMYAFAPGFDFSGLLLMGTGALIVLFWALHRAKKRHKTAAVLEKLLWAILAVAAAAAVVTGSLILARGEEKAEPGCSYVVVLGAGVNGTEPSMPLRERIDAAYAYLEENPDAVCIASGGQGNWEDITEAECIARELIGMGIRPERIWLEDRATNTRENLRFSLELIRGKTGDTPARIGLVSNDYHLYRAEMFAAAEGLDAVGIPAKTRWLPLRINYYLREIAAVWYYTVFGG